MWDREHRKCGWCKLNRGFDLGGNKTFLVISGHSISTVFEVFQGSLFDREAVRAFHLGNEHSRCSAFATGTSRLGLLLQRFEAGTLAPVLKLGLVLNRSDEYLHLGVFCDERARDAVLAE